MFSQTVTGKDGEKADFGEGSLTKKVHDSPFIPRRDPSFQEHKLFVVRYAFLHPAAGFGPELEGKENPPFDKQMSTDFQLNSRLE